MMIGNGTQSNGDLAVPVRPRISDGLPNKSLQLSPKRPSGTVNAVWQFHSALG